ncbi:hypothetical protein ACLB2K_040701 [Fragaria x ananassa]
MQMNSKQDASEASGVPRANSLPGLYSQAHSITLNTPACSSKQAAIVSGTLKELKNQKKEEERHAQAGFYRRE